MAALYNENDSFAAQWLRNLIDKKLIAEGAVNDQPIQSLVAEDVSSATQFHAFAGIGGWSYGLRLAGWPDDVPVWTGSCPCQPFSVAGKRKGFEDERHLWPTWAALIRSCLPTVVFGEQIAGADGRLWFEAVQADLEALGYQVGAADLCAAGVGAPHIRQRLFFGAVRLADTKRGAWREIATHLGRSGGGSPEKELEQRSMYCGVGDMGDTSVSEDGPHEGKSRQGDQSQESVGGSNISGDVGNPSSERLAGWESESRNDGSEFEALERAGSFWKEADWVPCRDGKARPTKPGIQLLAHGISGRLGRLCGYGNSIVPQVAAVFVQAFVESMVLYWDATA